MQGRVDDSHIKVSLMLVVSVRVRVRRYPGTKAPLPKFFQKSEDLIKGDNLHPPYFRSLSSPSPLPLRPNGSV